TREWSASLWSTLSFSWLDPLITLSKGSHLIHEELWGLMPWHASSFCYRSFQAHRRSSLVRTLIHQHAKDMLILAAHTIAWSLFLFLPPVCLSLLLTYLREQSSPSSSPQDSSVSLTQAILASLGLCLGSLGSSTSFQQGLHKARSLAIQVRATLTSEIFHATLQPNTSPSSSSSQEEVVSLVSVDVNKVAQLIAYHHYIYASALQIILALIFLHAFLGTLAAASCLFITLLLSPITAWITRAHGKIQGRVMKATDSRVDLVTQVLRGIRTIKYFAWESAFLPGIRHARAREVQELWSRLTTYIALNTMAVAVPILSMSITFIIFTRVSGGTLTASIAFPSLGLFSILRRAVEEMPEKMVYASDASVSLKRMRALMERDDPDFRGDQGQGLKVVVEEEEEEEIDNQRLGFYHHATFSWSKGEVAIKGVEVEFPKRRLSVIAGPTGSGKTALLMALLGELRCVEGRVRLPRGPHGKGVAYVPQQPWLQNATIRDNILFGEPYDLERYAETVKCCALQEDFRQLGAGDQTEVGEKGIALSGGQKQRISLARAVYSRASIVLMDDVLSAVDAHTARHLYEQCLLGPLMRPRTLILVTHYVDLCTRDAALALLLGSRGEIQGIGTPATLREQGIL
ncbi:MAG: P-loop containing nucleoside triphosphate hydrolase protein, partial [Piptocephalis tieghemiana]